MVNFQGQRKLFLAVAAAAVLTVAGCSNTAKDQAANQAPAPPKKAATPAKSASGKVAAPKPAAKKVEAAKPATAKGATAKQVAVSSPAVVSSKVTQQTTLVTVPKGTAISATVGQTLVSSKSHSGDSFAAILSSPIKVDGKTVVPKGAHVTGRVVSAKKAGPAQLTVALASVDVNGKSYKLVTEPINRSGKTPAKSNAGDTDAAKAKAKEKDISVPAESRLKFKLAKAVKIPVKS
jgi:hypothetical protein